MVHSLDAVFKKCLEQVADAEWFDVLFPIDESTLGAFNVSITDCFRSYLEITRCTVFNFNFDKLQLVSSYVVITENGHKILFTLCNSNSELWLICCIFWCCLVKVVINLVVGCD